MDLRVIPSSKLYVSEPDPRWFGNGPNEATNPHWTNSNWLKSRFHFSFAEYSNPRNDRFGVLRVLNDDLVQPDRGFGMHPHRDMEIVTYVVHGELTHADSMGSTEALGRGAVQFMSAGRGVTHSERNASPQTPLRFIQTWILPSAPGLAPRYGSRRGGGGGTKNRLRHLVTSLDKNHGIGDNDDDAEDAPVRVQQHLDAYAAELELGRSVTVDLPAGRQAYLLCVEGGLALNGGQAHLAKYDACEVRRTTGAPLTVEATTVEETEHGPLAHFLLFSMPEQPESGRRDL